MANSRIYFKSEAGGTTVLSRDTTATSGNLVLPASGNVASVDTAVTDNAIARYDSTTGKLQNSSVTIDDNSNVGIGLSNPHAKLSVQHNTPGNTGTNSNTVGSSIAIDGTLATQSLLGIRWTYDRVGIGGMLYTSQIVADTANNNALEMYTTGSSPLIFGTNTTERMRIDANGNVGIGVTPSAITSPYFKSIELGRLGCGIFSYTNSLTTSAVSGITSNAYPTYQGVVNWKYGDSTSGNRPAGKFSIEDGAYLWQTAPSGTAGNTIAWTNAMTLDANGKLIFGANTFAGRMSFTGDYAAYGETHITMRNNPTTNYGNVIFQNAAGTQVGYIQASSTATAYVTSSDYRLKDDIKPMIGSIERLMELKPCNFVWKETGYRVDGFIAHEVQEVVPEAATGVKDEMMEEEYEISPRVEATYDEEGNEITPVVEAVTGKRQVPKYQGIDQSKLVPLLTSALQDAILKIESLERRIEILEGAK